MMKLLRRQFLHLAAGAAALPAMPHIARAQAYPTKPVRIVVPFAAGGSADVLARLVAQHLSANLKQQFVVENRPGGGGMIGTQQFLATPPDGYTIGMTNLSTLSLVPVINATATYDALNDFTHISYIGGSPVVLAANPRTGVRTLEQFVAYSRAPGKAFTFASSGVGSTAPHGRSDCCRRQGETEHVLTAAPVPR
jgi:tripartite-type tricarboxylate transporter receptor subunit TctC